VQAVRLNSQARDGDNIQDATAAGFVWQQEITSLKTCKKSERPQADPPPFRALNRVCRLPPLPAVGSSAGCRIPREAEDESQLSVEQSGQWDL
jgi:hypothetical protein